MRENGNYRTEKFKSCWICSKVKWRQEETLNKLKTLIEFTKSEQK